MTNQDAVQPAMAVVIFTANAGQPTAFADATMSRAKNVAVMAGSILPMRIAALRLTKAR